MVSELPDHPRYRKTMDRLRAAQRTAPNGSAYWFAREIQSIFGYQTWQKFTPVIERARASLRANGENPSHHIVQTDKLMGVGRDARRRVVDYFLSRGACYLIAMNGDPSKPEIAAAQAYFAVSTRKLEAYEAKSEDERRLEARERAKEAKKKVSGVAQDAGVTSEKQPIFHGARYQGMYKMTLKDLRIIKGWRENNNPFDYMGALELSANEFQMNLAAETIKSEHVRGAQRAIDKNREIADRVRQTMLESGSPPPEQLPSAREPIKEVEKRLKAQKKLPKPPTP